MSRGDGPYTHGPSFALGPGGPKMTWEQRELSAAQESIWKHL